MRSVDWLEVQTRLLPERPGALRVATLILGRRQLAEDAVQEALIRAALAMHGVRESAAVRSWFRRIVVREALRLAGRHAREEAVAEPEPPEWAPAADGPAEEAEERAQAGRALASLSPPLRAAVALRYGLGLPVAETAAVLGVPVGTVKSRCAAARALLRRRMDRPLQEVVEMAAGHVRVVSGEEIASMNRDWAAGGNPEPRQALEEEVRAIFPDIRWPSADAVGLPFHSGRTLEHAPEIRFGWAWYGDASVHLMVGLFVSPEDWHTNIHDGSGAAVLTETVVGAQPGVWVARPDGVHYLHFPCNGATVVIAGNVPPARLRALAEEILTASRSRPE